MENDFVRYSRAGDEFHYRWAARRCLRLIYPKSTLESIVIEGSGPDESGLDGEYVMDVTEYSNQYENDSGTISYYQLKHTTTKEDTPFNLSDLRNTIEGFAARYAEHFCSDTSSDSSPNVTFTIVSNRRISSTFKKNFATIANGEKILRQDGKVSQSQKTIEEYTKLQELDLQNFCGLVEFADSEGNYNVQREDLRAELASILAVTVDDTRLANIIELVRSKVMPDSDGKIIREDVLRRFGVTSERQLFPAPSEVEALEEIIEREQHATLLQNVLEASTPIIIHAGGGVGKSVVAQQLANSLPSGSLGIVYDCFGGGKYRSRSETRHRHHDGLTQIANELAVSGLCAPLIAESATEKQITQQFLERLDAAISILREANEDAVLAIFIDAGDNAEMAAQQFSQSCFVNEMMREEMPDGCKLIVLCRTERIDLLQPSNPITKISLESFSYNETFNLLKKHLPDVTEDDALEFHRLTGGNPRVQSNALDIKEPQIDKVLELLGPSGTTVDKQIKAQLDSAISAVKHQFPPDYQENIDAICIGLAILPPFIPLTVLAAVADVDEFAVKSFVSDLGHPLWLSDTSVQFRDEPTETWFRERFTATSEQIATYITKIKPLSQTFSYVAEALPALLLQAEKYEELVELALSDELLPDNPIDGRNVRVYRLQFAFKAALKLKRYADSIKLALRAGEEVAGDKRQLELLSKNVDLIAPLQSAERVQELAFRRLLRGEWDGSENVYSAALLSSVEEFKGEARGYLRASVNWLHLYFDERDETQDSHSEDKLRDEDLVEMLIAHYNLFGATDALNFLLNWQPSEVIYRLAGPFISRLIDVGDFDTVNEISRNGSRNQYLVIAIAEELLKVGRFPEPDSMLECLTLLTVKRTRIPKHKNFNNAVLSFAEGCVANGLPPSQIVRLLRHYFPQKTTYSTSSISNRYQFAERKIYLRVVALRNVLTNNLEPDLEELLPAEWVQNKHEHKFQEDIRKFTEVVGGMLPWYLLRVRAISNDVDNALEDANLMYQRVATAEGAVSRDSGTLPYEISQVLVDIFALCQNADSATLQNFFNNCIAANKNMWMSERLNAVRIANRSDSYRVIRQEMEHSAYTAINLNTDENSITCAEWYMDLARAVLPLSPDDAAAYFDDAIEIVSKFGDEIMERWQAVAAIANCTAKGEHVSAEMAYRFVRCSEMVNEYGSGSIYGLNGATEIAVKLHPASALAALSRWRDRHVGLFYEQISALASEMINSESLAPQVGWALSAFFDGDKLDKFASQCISAEQSSDIKQLILDTAIRDLRLHEAEKSCYSVLKLAIQTVGQLNTEELDQIIEFYENQPEIDPAKVGSHLLPPSSSTEVENIEWSDLLDGLDFTSHSGLSIAIQRLDGLPDTHRHHDAFWAYIYSKINDRNAVNFLKALIAAEGCDLYDIKRALNAMPDSWNKKISVKRYRNEFLVSYASKFATEFTQISTHPYLLQRELKDLNVKADEMPSIRAGIIEALTNRSYLSDASTLFGFVPICSALISPAESYELLDYAIQRFELHIDEDYADGNWSEWLTPPDDTSTAFAGFIWAALGSPQSEIRWRAAHCVRRIADASCQDEIDALIECMARNEVGAFGSHKFLFYSLHARLYFLIALAKISVDNSDLLQKHFQVFAHYAIEGIPHVLIQKFAAEIALNIEANFPLTYAPETVEELQKIGVSQFSHKYTEHYFDTSFSSPWHETGTVNSGLDFYHGWDFEEYWCKPLGGVFGIPSEQVKELVTEVIKNEWKVKSDGSFYADPRVKLWESEQNRRSIWVDKGEYPRTDNHQFYLSYHALLVVASRLFQHMPVLYHQEYDENLWEDWIQEHVLTIEDGTWLSDRRDPAPLTRHTSVYQKKSSDWRWGIIPSDFLDGILLERNNKTWLNVFGSWEDNEGKGNEVYHVSTALVSPEVSESLLNALTTCRPDEFKLPYHKEQDTEIDNGAFLLKGWVWREHPYRGIDEFDPYAGDFPYPPYIVSEEIVNKLQLVKSSDLRRWSLHNSEQSSIICELWGKGEGRQNAEFFRQGSRLSASLAMLKDLCTVCECEVIFNVQIRRRFKYNSYLRTENGHQYIPAYHKIYLFSADGTLRDTRTSSQLR